MRQWKLAAVLIVAAAVATMGSSLIPSKVLSVIPASEGCRQGCEFVAGGWPFAYLVDHDSISPTGSVTLFFGEDYIRGPALGATFVFWLLVCSGIRAAFRYLRR